MANSNAASPATTQATVPGLADIQEPLLGNDWYLAPGWLVVMLIVLGLIVYVGYRLWNYHLQQKPLRFTLAELARLDLNSADAPEQITTLLKRLLMTKIPGHPALTYSGSAWQQFLISSLPPKITPTAPLPDLMTLHYQASPSAEDIRLYATFAAFWLQKVNLNRLGASHV